jgi:hypothetical protein
MNLTAYQVRTSIAVSDIARGLPVLRRTAETRCQPSSTPERLTAGIPPDIVGRDGVSDLGAEGRS